VEDFAPGLHDVLPGIFKHLHEDSGNAALCVAIRVCHGWFTAGIPLLWRSVAAWQLERVKDKSRRQVYAAHVQTLHVDGRLNDKSSHKSASIGNRLKPLYFPRLRGVTIRSASGASPSPYRPIGIDPFIHPRLTVLDCHAGELDHASLRQRLTTECPHLRQLHLVGLSCSSPQLLVNLGANVGGAQVEMDAQADATTASSAAHRSVEHHGCRRLAELLNGLPTVEVLGLRDSSLGECSVDLYAALAVRPALKTLLADTLDSIVLREILRHAPPEPFRALQRLDARIDPAALPLLVSALPSCIAELSLTFMAPPAAAGNHINGPPTKIDSPPPPPPSPPLQLSTLAPLCHLRKLHLSLGRDADVVLTADDIDGLAHALPPAQLLELSLTAQGLSAANSYVTYFDDRGLQTLLGRQPRLTFFNFTIWTEDITPAAFRIAGEACRHLEELTLLQKCFLREMGRSCVRPLFPRLRRLRSCDPDPAGDFWEASEWE
jgi:hypothetical protein